MRVPEAVMEIVKLSSNGPGIIPAEIEKILDAVWLQAYKEGETHVFCSPGSCELERNSE